MLAAVLLAWPVLHGVQEVTNLETAAKMLRDVLVECRKQALVTGKIHVFRFELDGPGYAVDALDVLEETAPSDKPDWMPGDALLIGPTERRLPPQVRFDAADDFQDEQAFTVGVLHRERHEVMPAPPLVFYPNGTSSTATLYLRHRGGHVVSVQLRGGTAQAFVGEVRAADQAP